MTQFIENIPGATPIEDVSDLIPQHINNRSELNEWESANILKAVKKYLTLKRHIAMDVAWLQELHREMFDETWKWAGKFRQKNYNLGIDWHNIPEQIKTLIDDLTYWKTVTAELNVLEQSIRLHHRLVKIHPFVNGNGRHARLAADIFLYVNDQPLPNWPNQELIEGSDVRNKYIEALQNADKGDYKPLAEFTAGSM